MVISCYRYDATVALLEGLQILELILTGTTLALVAALWRSTAPASSTRQTTAVGVLDRSRRAVDGSGVV